MFQLHPVKISLVSNEYSWRNCGHKVAIFCKSVLLENWCDSQYGEMPLLCLSAAFSLGNSWNLCTILRLYTLPHVLSALYWPCSDWPTDWWDMRSDTVIYCYVSVIWLWISNRKLPTFPKYFHWNLSEIFAGMSQLCKYFANSNLWKVEI